MTGDIYVSWGDGVIRRYTSAGALADGSFATGRAMEFGPGNPTLGSGLYTVNNVTGAFLRVGHSKNVTMPGTGFRDVRGLAFGTDGALYLTELGRDRALRVSCLPSPGEVGNLRLAPGDSGGHAAIHLGRPGGRGRPRDQARLRLRPVHDPDGFGGAPTIPRQVGGIHESNPR